MDRRTRHHHSVRREKHRDDATTTMKTQTTKMFYEMAQQEKFNLIAELSEDIIHDPMSAFVSSKDILEGRTVDEPEQIVKTNKVKTLIDVASCKTPAQFEDRENVVTVIRSDQGSARLAMVSLLAVFQDILPTYRIRLPTQAEMSVKVSKEKKILWTYERALLLHYQSFLRILEKTWEKGNKESRNNVGGRLTNLAATSMLCLAELCKSAMHFNFRSNILLIVVRNTSHRVDEICERCCEAISHVFRYDVQGEFALEATHLVAKMIKDRNFHVRPQALRTFHSLPLRVHEDEAQAADLHATAKSKKRKRYREQVEIEDEMRESDANVDKGILAKSQAETLNAVTLSYFRIIKHASTNLEKDEQELRKIRKLRSCVYDLLPTTLEGLAKFVQLINIDTVIDLLGVLKQLLAHADKIPLEGALNCMLTAFQTLQGPGQELKIDQNEYVTPLYNQLTRLCYESHCASAEVALNCLNSAFVRRKEFSMVRVAAFFKQLCTVATIAPPCTSAAIICFARVLAARYPSVRQLLESEQDIVASGSFTPEVGDPEHTNPFASSAWELGLLKFHVNPHIARQAIDCSTENGPLVPVNAPGMLFRKLRCDSEGCCIRMKMVHKKHPLRLTGKRRMAQRQLKFISPRKSNSSLFSQQV